MGWSGADNREFNICLAVVDIYNGLLKSNFVSERVLGFPLMVLNDGFEWFCEKNEQYYKTSTAT